MGERERSQGDSPSLAASVIASIGACRAVRFRRLKNSAEIYIASFERRHDSSNHPNRRSTNLHLTGRTQGIGRLNTSIFQRHPSSIKAQGGQCLDHPRPRASRVQHRGLCKRHSIRNREVSLRQGSYLHHANSEKVLLCLCLPPVKGSR